MLEFSDLPYRFVPPKPNHFIIGLGRFVNRFIGLPSKNHLINKIQVDGLENFLKTRADEKARYVIVCNHPTHSDPQVINEICRRMNVRPAFMAAYDVFARSKITSWVMQRVGAFSVDREASDRKAMKCAGEILQEGKYPLVIFPEGNVYLCNDRVMPFAEGAAFIALRSQMKLGNDHPVYIITVSLKYTHIEDVRNKVTEKLKSIALKFNSNLSSEKPIMDEITRISVLTLAEHLNNHGHNIPEEKFDVERLINDSSEQIIKRLEEELNIKNKSEESLMSRIRTIRSRIHASRIDKPNTTLDEIPESTGDEAMLALRILGYSGGYAKQNPNIDRITETIIRLSEDIHSNLEKPIGKRNVYAKIGEPIDLRTRMNSDGKIDRDSISKLTEDLEDNIQMNINKMNEENQNIGSQTF